MTFLFTSSGVDDLDARGHSLSQHCVFGGFQGDSEGLVVFLQTVVYQVNVPGLHTDSWTTDEETGCNTLCCLERDPKSELIFFRHHSCWNIIYILYIIMDWFMFAVIIHWDPQRINFLCHQLHGSRTWSSVIGCFYQQCFLGLIAMNTVLDFCLDVTWNQWCQTWIKLDQSGCAVSEISAGPGWSFLHLLRHDNTNTELINLVMMSLQWVWGASPAYLDSHVRRVGTLAAALDLDLKRPRRLTGSVAGGRQLHPRPEQLQSAGDATGDELVCDTWRLDVFLWWKVRTAFMFLMMFVFMHRHSEVFLLVLIKLNCQSFSSLTGSDPL